MSQNSKSLLLATQEAVKRAATISPESESEGYRAIDSSFRALSKLAAYVDDFDCEGAHYCPECGRKGVSLETAGKVTSYISKVLNDVTRLLEFAKGNADSRAEVKDGMTDLVKKLTGEQLATVLQWMDENEEHAIPQ